MSTELINALKSDAECICIPPSNEEIWEFHSDGENAGTGIMVFTVRKGVGAERGSIWTLDSDGLVTHKNWSANDKGRRKESDAVVGRYALGCDGDFQSLVKAFEKIFLDTIRETL